MANEFVDILRPRDLIRGNGQNSIVDLVPTPGGDLQGVPLRKLDNEYYQFITQIPGSLTVGTGLTFTAMITDDGVDADDLGKVVRLGVTVKRLVSGTDNTDLDSGASAEATVDITLDATSGEVKSGTAAIANAALDSIAAGDVFAVRVRRIGSHANDTCKGRAILLVVGVKNT